MSPRNVIAGSTFVIAASLGLGAPAMAADVYELDPAHTDIVFMVSHFGFSDTIGRFNEAEGTIVMDDQNLPGSSIELVIDAASIDTNHAERDQHLKGPDFFNVAEYPTITFESTGIEKTGEDTAEVTGDLTMHGTTKPVTLHVTLNKVAPHPVPDYDGVMTAGFSARGTDQAQRLRHRHVRPRHRRRGRPDHRDRGDASERRGLSGRPIPAS